MAEGGFFARLGNLWKGFLSVFVGGIEKDNPEAVYEAAIEARKKDYARLKKAVSGIIVLRNKLAAESEEKNKELAEVDAQIAAAVEGEEDDVALVLLERKEAISGRLAELDADLEKARHEAEEAKASIVAFQSEIEKLEREKVQMLARKETAAARIQIQETLDGLSMQADIKALDNVREHINQLHAEADVGAEIAGSELGKKLERIKAKAGSASARTQLDALKKARESARAQAAEGIKKSM